MIREEGPRAATLKNIATRAGITEPAIFRHFDGVDGLFGGLFGVYERVYKSSSAAYAAEGQGMAKLRAACALAVDNIAASRDFAYILVHARHVFRGYAEFKAKIAENDAKDQAIVLACINEGVKAGELRSDIDAVSAAVSLIGAIYVVALMWIESGFGFDLASAFGDRWDDFERMVATKSAPKARDSKAARERSASYFPLRPAASKSRSSSAKKVPSKQDAKKKSKAGAKQPKASKPPKAAVKASPKSAPKKAPIAKAATAKSASAKSGSRKPGAKGK